LQNSLFFLPYGRVKTQNTGSLAVHTVEGVISHRQASFAAGSDSQYLPPLTGQVANNQIRRLDIVADAASSNGSNYHFLEQGGISGWIPVSGQYKPAAPGFPYNQEADGYTCHKTLTLFSDFLFFPENQYVLRF
jgi:hypothetical protein